MTDEQWRLLCEEAALGSDTEKARQLRRIMALPPLQRAVVIAVVVERQKQPQAARRLRISERKLRYVLAKARAALLGQEEGPSV